MIECIFTIDYEIYGNAEGSLSELVLEPTRQLAAIFKQWHSRFVIFAEAVEFQKIQEHRTDPAIDEVAAQLRQLREEGFEVGLHLHPWWANARHEHGAWLLDWSERNICALPESRIRRIVHDAINYLREALQDPAFAPVSFRGGLWLMQPTPAMARVLSEAGLQVDSSVFKGGRVRESGLDYRPAARNGWFWRFREDVNRPDPAGSLVEMPIYTQMVPFWKMMRGKRLGVHKRVPTSSNGAPVSSRYRDFARLRYPRKFDFCRMDFSEMRSAIDAALREDRSQPRTYRPMVAIGHTKDLVDFEAIAKVLDYLRQQGIAVTDFPGALKRLQGVPQEVQV